MRTGNDVALRASPGMVHVVATETKQGLSQLQKELVTIRIVNFIDKKCLTG